MINSDFVVPNHCTTPQTAGPRANKAERKAVMQAACWFIKNMNYSPRTKVMWPCRESRLPKLHPSYLVFLFMNMPAPLSISHMNRSTFFQQGPSHPCLSSSSQTGWTRMRPLAQVRVTPWVTSLRWSRFPSTPPSSTITTAWLPSTAWWMMAPGISRCGH